MGKSDHPEYSTQQRGNTTNSRRRSIAKPHIIAESVMTLHPSLKILYIALLTGSLCWGLDNGRCRQHGTPPSSFLSVQYSSVANWLYKSIVHASEGNLRAAWRFFMTHILKTSARLMAGEARLFRQCCSIICTSICLWRQLLSVVSLMKFQAFMNLIQMQRPDLFSAAIFGEILEVGFINRCFEDPAFITQQIQMGLTWESTVPHLCVWQYLPSA